VKRRRDTRTDELLLRICLRRGRVGANGGSDGRTPRCGFDRIVHADEGEGQYPKVDCPDHQAKEGRRQDGELQRDGPAVTAAKMMQE
jgi:hypothetical protein